SPLRRDVGLREDQPRMEPRAKWDGREPATARRCSLPGCRGVAIATVRVDSSARRAWIVDLRASGGDDVCAHHLDALAPPADWTIHDERRRARRDPASVTGT